MTTTIRLEQALGGALRSSGILECMNIEETFQHLLVFYRPGCLCRRGCVCDHFSGCSGPNPDSIRDATPDTTRARKRMILVPRQGLVRHMQ